MKVYNSFNEIYKSQRPVKNGLYHDWSDRGYLNIIGDEMDRIRTHAMTLLDGFDETAKNPQENLKFYPNDMAKLLSDMFSDAMYYYEQKSIEQGKLLDTDLFVSKVGSELYEGLAGWHRARKDISPHADKETEKRIKDFLEELETNIKLDRPRVAKLVRTAKRWPDR